MLQYQIDWCLQGKILDDFQNYKLEIFFYTPIQLNSITSGAPSFTHWNGICGIRFRFTSNLLLCHLIQFMQTFSSYFYRRVNTTGDVKVDMKDSAGRKICLGVCNHSYSSFNRPASGIKPGLWDRAKGIVQTRHFRDAHYRRPSLHHSSTRYEQVSSSPRKPRRNGPGCIVMQTVN